MADITTIPDDKNSSTCTVEFASAAGNVVPVSAMKSVTWTTSDSTVIAVEPSADGATCVVRRVGPLGTAQVTVTGTNQDDTQVIGIEQFDVVAGSAVTANIQPGAPE